MIIPPVLNTFEFIICCETENTRTMTLGEISNQLGDSEKIIYFKSPTKAIHHGISLLKNDIKKMAIIGTHHFGEPISRIFNKSFNKL